MSTLRAIFQPHGPVPITVRTQTLDGTALVTVTLGGYFEGELTIQGAAADIVHLVEVLRAEVVTAVGRAWPVQTAHDIPPRQCGVADCPEMATHKSGWLVACEAHAMGRQAENGCKAIPLATTVPALTNRSLG